MTASACSGVEWPASTLVPRAEGQPGLVCGEPCSSGAAAHPANDFIAGKAVLQHPWHELIDIDRIRQVPGRLVG